MLHATVCARERGYPSQGARGRFEGMHSDGLQAEVIMYSATICACGQGMRW